MTDPATTIRGRLRHTAKRLGHLKHVTQALKTLQARRRKQLASLVAPSVMYDSVTLNAIPPDAKAVAGYVGGRFLTYPTILVRWPKARHLSIAVASTQDAECLDVELGDAPPSLAPAWVKRQRARGVVRPVVYTSVSGAQALVNLLEANGVPRQAIRLWTAHYTHREHLCGPSCGFGLRGVADATQWTDKALGRNLDQSLTTRGFWT
jgi:hypothetical protein